MKKFIKNDALRSAALLLLTVVLVAGATVKEAWSYFTTYATAKGSMTIELEEKTEIEEDFAAWKKTVVISADEKSKPVYARVKAFGGDDYTLTYSDESGKWNPGEDGYYYYIDILQAGKETEPLVVTISDVPTDVEPGADFHVIIVYESSLVLFDADGNPYYDWKLAADTGEEKEEG